jgi:hypothetical protein
MMRTSALDWLSCVGVEGLSTAGAASSLTSFESGSSLTALGSGEGHGLVSSTVFSTGFASTTSSSSSNPPVDGARFLASVISSSESGSSCLISRSCMLGNLPVISVTLVCLTGTGLGSSLTAGVGAGAGVGVADDLGPSYVVDALVSRSITLGAEVLPESHSSAVRAASRDGAGGKMLDGLMSLYSEKDAVGNSLCLESFRL